MGRIASARPPGHRRLGRPVHRRARSPNRQTPERPVNSTLLAWRGWFPAFPMTERRSMAVPVKKHSNRAQCGKKTTSSYVIGGGHRLCGSCMPNVHSLPAMRVRPVRKRARKREVVIIRNRFIFHCVHCGKRTSTNHAGRGAARLCFACVPKAEDIPVMREKLAKEREGKGDADPVHRHFSIFCVLCGKKSGSTYPIRRELGACAACVPNV